MDNRLKFLYPVAPEMWGRGHKRHAGKGKTGASAAAAQEEKPLCTGAVARSGANIRVAKCQECLPGKAAIVCHGPVP